MTRAAARCVILRHRNIVVMNALVKRRSEGSRRLAVAAAAIAFSGAIHAQSMPGFDAAQTPSTALLGNVDFAVDADGVHVSSVRLGGAHACGSYLTKLGFVAPLPNPRITAPTDGSAFAALLGRPTVAGGAIEAEAGIVQVGGRTRIVGDATWRARPVATTGVDLIAAADVVGTQAAIDRGIAYGFVGAAAEQALAERITARGLAGVQSFTDGNERLHMRARLTWQALPAYGVEAVLRWRQYESRDDAFDGAYFNPDRYAQWQGMLDMRHRIGAWTLAGTLGAGFEAVDGGERRPVRTIAVRAEGALVERLRLSVHARYNRSKDDADVADFSYGQAGVTLSYPF